MAVSVTETEIKYEAPAGVAWPPPASPFPFTELPQVAGTRGPDEQRLEAEYFDTADLRLLQARITLRRRLGGDDAGWHLKVPAGAGTRREIRLPPGAEDQAGAVPGELADLVRAHTRGEPLRPVAHLATRRHRLILVGPSGESLAEVAADDVSAQTMGESTTVSRWQELEVELTGGDRALLEAAGDLLRRHSLRPAAWASKLEHALGYRRPQPADRPALSPSSPAGQVVLDYLTSQAEALKSQDMMVRRDEPGAVHDMRVAARRLRSTLRTFRRILRRADTGELAGELKWLGGVLGEPRDAEVLAGHLLAALGQFPAEQVVGPVQARVRARFAPARAEARSAAMAALRSQRYFSLLDRLDELLADPPFGPWAPRPAGEVLPAEVRRAYRRTARRVRRAVQAPRGPSRDRAWHQARKAAKQARYAAEAVTPVAGKQARRFAKRMKKVQSVLGDHQDAVMARSVERELGMSAHLGGENAFTYGLLHGRETCDAERLQVKARRAWKRASRSRGRRWMRPPPAG